MQKLTSRRAGLVSFIAAGVSAVLGLAGALRAGPTVAELAPSTTVLMVAVPDYGKFIEAWKASDYSKLLAEPSVRKWAWELLKMAGRAEPEIDENGVVKKPAEGEGLGVVERVMAYLDDADVKIKDLPSPSGAVGAAFYLHTGEDGKLTGKPEVVAVVNFDAEGAGKFDAALDKVLARAEEKRHVEVGEVTHGAVKIRTIQPRKGAEDKGGPSVIDGVFVGRVGNAFVAALHLNSVKAAIDNAEGKATGTLASTAVYRDTAALMPAGSVLHAAAYVEALTTLVNNKDAMDSLEAQADLVGPAGGLLQMLEPLRGTQSQVMLKALGVKGTRSISAAVTLGTERAAAQTDVYALMPVKQGVMKLLGGEAGKGFELPRFFHADVTTAVSSRIDLAKAFGVVRQDVLPALPEEMRGEVEPMLQQAEGLAGPVLAAAGPEVYGMSTISMPLDTKSEPRPVYILKMRDAAALRNLLAGFGAQAGLKAKEFEGNQIFASEEGMGLPLAVGIGFEHVFVGEEELVRGAMRAAGGGGGGGALSAEARFKAAAGAVEPGAMLYLWSDTRKGLAHSIWKVKNLEKILREQIADSGLPPEMSDRIIKQALEANKGALNVPDAELLSKYLGDSVGELHWREYGLHLRYQALRP